MEDAWQSQDVPASNGGGISIPTADGPGPMDESWDRREDGNRGRSRSRSPVGDRGRGRDGGEPKGLNPGNNLHVSGLSTRVDSRDLEAAFAKCGRVQKAQVMLDPHSRESRGFAFVTMETAAEADAAITALNATEFMGKTLNVERARRGRARTPTPGRYYGPPKRGDRERPYDPRPYDARYARDRPDDRRGGRYDDGKDRGRYDRYDERERGYGRDRDYDRGGYGGGRDRYDDRRGDDRRY